MKNLNTFTLVSDNEAVENNGYGAPRSFFDIEKLYAENPSLGPGVIYRNRSPLPIIEMIYSRYDLECHAVGQNADDFVVDAVRELLGQGVKNIFLITGDADIAMRVGALTSRFGATLKIACKGRTLNPTIEQFSDLPVVMLDRYIATPPHKNLKPQKRRPAFAGLNAAQIGFAPKKVFVAAA